LKENEDDDQHQGHGFKQRFDNVMDAGPHRQRGVERNLVIHILGELFLQVLHQLLGGVNRGDRVGARQLIHRDNRRRPGVVAADDIIRLRPQLNPRDIPEPDNRAVRVGADNDVAKLLLRLQPALGPDSVGELLPRRHGLGTDLASGIDGVLRVDRVDNLVDRHAQLGQRVRLDPEPHRILARAENLHLPNARNTRHRIIDVDERIIGEKLGVVGTLGRIEREQRQGVVGGFADRYAEIAHICRQLRLRLQITHLRQNLGGIGDCAHLEIHIERKLAGAGIDRIHVLHVVYAADLLLDRRGNRLFHGQRVSPNISGGQLDFRRSDIRELRDRQAGNGHPTQDHHDDRDHHGHDRTIDKKLGHARLPFSWRPAAGWLRPGPARRPASPVPACLP